MALHFEDTTVTAVNEEEMDWMFEGMGVFGGSAEERRGLKLMERHPFGQ